MTKLTLNIAGTNCADRAFAVPAMRVDFGNYPEWHQQDNEGTIKGNEPGKEM